MRQTTRQPRETNTGRVTQSRRSVLGALAGTLTSAVGMARGAPVSSAETFLKVPKSMWIWNTEAEGWPDLGAFARRWNIGRLLLGLRPVTLDRLAAGDAKLLGAIQKLRDEQLEVIALAGDPSWVDHKEVPASVRKIFEIASHRKLFDGLDLDVEPHALPAWHAGGAQRDRLMLGHLALFETLAKHSPGLLLGAALHPIYARLKLPDGRNYLDALCHTLQSASLMAYRNHPEATIRWSADAIAVFERAKKPWRSGVLVHKSTEPNISYIWSTPPKFIGDMTELNGELRSSATATFYRGLIFEDYKGLRTLLAA